MQSALIDFEPNYESAKFPTPRPFQDSAHDKLREGARNGHRCQMLMSPTGSGKTLLGMRAIHESLLRGKKAIFLCDRTTLINQTSEVADSYGLTAHSIIQSGHWRYDLQEKFQIASVQTLARRSWPDADLIVIDESHTLYKSWTDHIPNCRAHVIGLSATPFSRGLGKLFTNLINAATMHELTESGVLVPMRVYSCARPDMRGAETSGGEWTAGAAAERGMELIGDVVQEWIKLAENRKTILFGPTIAYCEEMCRRFNESGIMAAVFTSETTDSERKELLNEFRKNNSVLRVLLSVEALAKGFDVKDVGCVVDCRPLRKSLSTAIQMWGRGLRSSPDTGKEDCIAQGSRVLTDRGLVEIENVLLEDKVWDGYEFVSHEGVINRGKKTVITYAGLTATSNHLVKTAEGWRSFGDCAAQQIAIITTGIGGERIWACEDYFTGSDSSRAASWNASSCFMRLHDLWLSFIYSAVKPYKWCIERLQILQQAKKNTFMASGQMCRDGASMQEQKGSEMESLWGSRNRVSIQRSDGLRDLDCGESWNSRERKRYGVGQNRQRWSLRARQSEMGNQTTEYVKQEGESVGSNDAQIYDRSPGGKVRRIYLEIIIFFRNVFRRNPGKIQEAVTQTEREVWDIINCGPRNSFTCEGLLVHNCVLLDFSGNIIRFADDFSDIYYNGLDQLDAGEKLDKTIRKDIDEDDKEPAKCPSCGFSPCGKRCIACGHETKKKNIVEHLPGSLCEIKIGKHVVASDHLNLWQQICTYTKSHGKPETASGRAFHLYKYITKKSPDRAWKFCDQPNVVITQGTHNQIKRNQIAYINAIKRGVS